MIGEFPLLLPLTVGGSGVAQDRIASTGEVDDDALMSPAAEIPTKSEEGEEEEEEEDVESVLDERFISLFSIFLVS